VAQQDGGGLLNDARMVLATARASRGFKVSIWSPFSSLMIPSGMAV